jgi:uncharacterized protein (DUF2141 family)
MMMYLVIFLLSLLHPSGDHALTVVLKSDQVLTGTAFIAIYDSEESFLTVEQAVYTTTFNARDGKIEVQLPKGNYAISTYVDENGNQKLDKNWVGYPSEPFGFSRNAAIMMGPPSYRDASIDLRSDMVCEITLR